MSLMNPLLNRMLLRMNSWWHTADGRLAVWRPCEPLLKVYPSLLSLSSLVRVDILPPEETSTSSDLAWCLPFEGFFGCEDLDRLLDSPRQTSEKWFILPQFTLFTLSRAIFFFGVGNFNHINHTYCCENQTLVDHHNFLSADHRLLYFDQNRLHAITSNYSFSVLVVCLSVVSMAWATFNKFPKLRFCSIALRLRWSVWADDFRSRICCLISISGSANWHLRASSWRRI